MDTMTCSNMTVRGSLIMAKRCIFFIQDNLLYKKTVDALWDTEAVEFNKSVCGEDIFKQSTNIMQPCIDVSPNSPLKNGRSLNIYNVKNDKGATFKQTLDFIQQGSDADKYPDSCYDLVYIANLHHNLSETTF